MASLSSTSTDAEVKAAYDDNASYAEDASATKAAAFVTACRILLRRLPKRGKLGGRHEIELDPKILRLELSDARQWLATNASGAGSGLRAFSLEDYRD